MSTTEKKQEENTQKKPEEQKSWLEIANEFIKNPAATFGMGGLGGFLLAQHLSGKQMERLKEEHRLQLEEKDKQINKLIDHTQKMSERMENSLRGLLENAKENTEDLEQDPTDKVYRPKKRQFRLK
ncbi:MAG: hypothetical protein ACK40M_06315 [Flavobacteriales bacterium]